MARESVDDGGLTSPGPRLGLHGSSSPTSRTLKEAKGVLAQRYVLDEAGSPIRCAGPARNMQTALTPEAPDRKMPWAQKLWHCARCGAELGKLRLRRRHHCRICTMSVCDPCSRSKMQLCGKAQAPVRVCLSCAQLSLQVPDLTRRLDALSNRFSAVSSSTDRALPFESLEESVLFCTMQAQPTPLRRGPRPPPPPHDWLSDNDSSPEAEGRAASTSAAPTTSAACADLDGPRGAGSEPGSQCRLQETPCLPRWDEHVWECCVCEVQLGKVRLRPRHHCRLCGRSVCAECSASRVQLECGELVRACLTCVSAASKIPAVKRTLGLWVGRLAACAGQRLGPPPCNSLEGAMAFCEGSMASLERTR